MYSTAFLMGGLGNQMFQIANAYAQALDNNIDCVFKINSETSFQGSQPSKYQNNIFRNIKFDDSISEFIVYEEQDFAYSKKQVVWNTSVQFYGYYQSSKNFLNYQENIKNLFSIDQNTKKHLQDKHPEIKSENTLSLHIRRGDYKNFSYIHPVITKSYIDSAIQKLESYSHIFVFSDDKNWVKENLFYENMILVDLEDYLELWLMSLCSNNIISNSSFSWWGAYLNRNKDKKVFCPSKWFGPQGPKNFSDIYESNWTKISVDFLDGELVAN